MTKHSDDTQINVKDISTSIKNVSPEEQQAAQRVYDEFEALTLGKKEMNMKEFYELKLYAKKRTNLEKNDAELTPDEAMWKLLYSSIEKTLIEKMNPDEKANLDHLQEEMDSLGELSDSASKIMPLGQEIETEIVMQRAALTVYFDKGPENEYKMVVDGITTDLVNPDKWSPSERIEKAETVLKIINANREYLYKKQLVERHETIHRKLRDFEKIYRDIDSAIAKNPNVLQDPSLHKLLNTTKEWLRLTKDLYAGRTGAISAVKNSIEVDEFLPKLVLEKNGDVGGTVENTAPFVEQMAASAVLINKASEVENEITQKRDPLSEELFGKAESYINFPKENTSENASEKIQETKSGMGTKTKWFIVIALSIVALSWGIWTAIGVFILGTIMINVLSGK